MKKIRIGIQGGEGSTNERACRFFAQKYGWEDFTIDYLVTTENVLRALDEGAVDYGTFAWKSSRAGLVAETQEAIKKYAYTKIDEHAFQLDHALLSRGSVDIQKTITVFSHPQALAEHKNFLEKTFPLLVLKEAIDTGLAAKNLRDKKYPANSLVIAPIGCAELYSLAVFQKDLPGNIGYETTIYLARKAEE